MAAVGIEDVVLEEEDILHPYAEPLGSNAPAHKRLAHFIKRDHPYVLLGTDAVCALGLWFGSFGLFEGAAVPAGVLAALMAWLGIWMCFSVFALLGKVMHWRDWRSWSPLVTPAGRKVLRWGSYITWAFVVVLFFLGPVAALVNQWQLVAAMSTNPSDFLQSSLYMLQQSGQVFGTGILTTIELAVFGTCIAFVLALGLVFLRIQTPDLTDNDAVKFFKALGSGFARVYSTVIRGTPMMVQGMLIYSLGFAAFRATGMTVTEVTGVWTVFIAGLVTISLNSTAYMMEVLRGGIESVDGGQMEAARSLGLSQWQAMRKVVFPQGIKNSIPALSNELIVNIKDSSVLSVIGVFDLMFATTTVAGLYYKQMEVYVIAAVCYLALTMIFSRVLTALSRKLDVDAPGPVMSE